MATLSSPGLGSNLDVNSIVNQLMALERRPLAGIAREQGAYQAQLSAYGMLKGALSSLQGTVQNLDSVTTFRGMKASSADATVVGASATSGAGVGSYSIEVLQLAQQHKLNSAAFTDATSTVGSGMLTFQFGSYDSGGNTFTLNSTKAAQNVVIAEGQSTLSGIRDAVNNAGIGVTASIVNDGGGSRLVFASKDSGAANSVKISIADADGNHTNASGLSQLAYDPTASAGAGKNLTQSLAAQDASLRVDGIGVTSASNTVSSAIEGVSLNLVKAAPGTNVNVQVARDSATVKTGVESFVRAYNDFNKTVSDLIAYDPATKQGGLLQGDTVAIGVQRGLRMTLNNAIAGLSGNITRLSQIGVSYQKDGSLTLDAAKLQSAIDKNFEDIAGLFSTVGRSSDARVAYQGSSTDTRPGAYPVQITQVATRGTLSGSQAANLTITSGVNDSFVLKLDGTSALVTLGAGTYASAQALAAELQSRINGTTAFVNAGVSATVSAASGVLSITSAKYGSSSTIGYEASAGASGLLGASPSATDGVDVAGSINGVSAKGDGQNLIGASGDASAGLTLKITAASAGALGTLSFSRGYASQLKNWSSDLLGSKGALASRTEGLGARVKSATRRQEELNFRLDEAEKRYRNQFAALDASISRMTSTSTYLQTQLANLPKVGQ